MTLILLNCQKGFNFLFGWNICQSELYLLPTSSKANQFSSFLYSKPLQIGDNVLACPFLKGLLNSIHVKILDHTFSGCAQSMRTRLIELKLPSSTPPGKHIERIQLEAAARAALGSNRQEDLASLGTIAENTPVLKLYFSMDHTIYEVTNI